MTKLYNNRTYVLFLLYFIVFFELHVYNKILSVKSYVKISEISEELNKILNNKFVMSLIIIFYNYRLYIYQKQLARFDFDSISPLYHINNLSNYLIKYAVEIVMFLLLFFQWI